MNGFFVGSMIELILGSGPATSQPERDRVSVAFAPVAPIRSTSMVRLAADSAARIDFGSPEQRLKIALEAANKWVEKAESRDLVPARGVESQSISPLGEMDQPQLGFDQPRLSQISPPGSQTGGLRSLARTRSISAEIAGLGDPGNVAVAAKIQRTRITGTGVNTDIFRPILRGSND